MVLGLHVSTNADDYAVASPSFKKPGIDTLPCKDSGPAVLERIPHGGRAGNNGPRGGLYNLNSGGPTRGHPREEPHATLSIPSAEFLEPILNQLTPMLHIS